MKILWIFFWGHHKIGLSIFTHTLPRPIYGVQNSEFQYFWGFSEKSIFLGGMKILWIFFGGSSQNWASSEGHFYLI